jgi:hypothetical protein
MKNIKTDTYHRSGSNVTLLVETCGSYVPRYNGQIGWKNHVDERKLIFSFD